MELIREDGNLAQREEQSSFWDFKSKYDFVDEWFLMDTPYPIMAITVAYLLFVLKLGPDYMKNRNAFKLKKVLLFYNTFQVFLSAWMAIQAGSEMIKVGIVQSTCLTDTYESKHRLATLTYYYFSCKVTELCDTVLFVLRKSQNQVTFLHVYHHTSTMCMTWIFIKYEPAYWLLFAGAINSSIHVIMYTYYGLSAYPSLQKYLWWKKYITTLQLIQFGLVMVQMTINLFVNECKPSSLISFYMYFNVLLFIYLFTRFYKNTYSNKNKKLPYNMNNNENGIHLNTRQHGKMHDTKNNGHSSNGLNEKSN